MHSSELYQERHRSDIDWQIWEKSSCRMLTNNNFVHLSSNLQVNLHNIPVLSSSKVYSLFIILFWPHVKVSNSFWQIQISCNTCIKTISTMIGMKTHSLSLKCQKPNFLFRVFRIYNSGAIYIYVALVWVI